MSRADPIKRTRQLHNGLKPVIGTCSFSIRNSAALANQFLTASADPLVIVTRDGADYFAGQIRRTVKVSVGQLYVDALECQCVDPLYRLESKKIRTSIVWSGYKICDPTTKTASILHQLFYLAGFADAELNLTAINTVIDKYSVNGVDTSVSLRTEIETILRDCVYTLRPTRDGILELYDLAPATYTPSGTIKTGSGGNIAEGYEAQRDEYKEEAVDVTYWTHKTLSSQVVFEDTTGATASLPCSIPLTAGSYYPSGAEAGESVRGAYAVTDEELVCVESAALEWAHTGDVTLQDSTEDGLGMLLRFYSAMGGVITKLRIRGTATIKDQKNKVSEEIVASSDEREDIESKLLTVKADAERLAAGRAAWHKNATYRYTFKKLTVAGTFSSDTDYPSERDYPGTADYPMEDVLLPGDILTFTDSVLLGATQTLRVVKIVDGTDPKTFYAEMEAVGDYTASPIAGKPQVTAPQAPRVYPSEKPLASLSDPVDFPGQYGIYGSQRYVGSGTTTWTLDDVGQTATQVAATVASNSPRYLGSFTADPSGGMNSGDFYYRNNTTPKKIRRYTTAWADVPTSDAQYSAYLGMAFKDISATTLAGGDDGFSFLGAIAGNAAFFNVLKAISGFFENLTVTGTFVGNIWSQVAANSGTNTTITLWGSHFIVVSFSDGANSGLSLYTSNRFGRSGYVFNYIGGAGDIATKSYGLASGTISITGQYSKIYVLNFPTGED